MSVDVNRVKTGQNKSALFDGGELAQNEENLDQELSSLKHLVEGDELPWLGVVLKPMQCIEWDAESSFALDRPNSKARDVWWSHLEAQYMTDAGVQVMSKTIPVAGCYLDLAERTSGKLQESYGRDLVNVYIPTLTTKEIHAAMQGASDFTKGFAQGKEIVDHEQGLTSFLCQKVDKSELNVVLYTPLTDDDGNVVEYERIEYNLSTLYDTAKESPKYRLLGGVAFLRFGLSYLSDSGSYEPSQPLPTDLLPDVKVKIMAFHMLCAAGEDIKQITYKSKTKKRY
jgi:hypothetical protein